MKEILKNKLKLDHIAVITILVSILLVYPVMAFVPGVWFNFIADIRLFQSSTITLLCLAFILFRIEKAYTLSIKYKAVHIGLIVLIIPALIHFHTHPTYSQEHFLMSIRFALIPYCIYLYADIFRKYLSWFLNLFWFLNAFIAGTLYSYGTEFAGIPGNRNWHATFLIITTPFLIYNLYIYFRKNDLLRKIFPIITCVILGITACAVYICYSRAGNIAFGIAVMFYIFLIAKPAYKKIMLHIFAALIAIIAIFAYTNWDLIDKKVIKPDVRLALWRACIELASDNVLIGVGEPSFESKLAEYRGIDYYVKKNAATRTNHPHNHFLYYLSSNGIIAFFIWGCLIFFPLITIFLKFKSVKPDIKLISMATLILVIHGCLDLPLYEWPTNMFFLLFLGILWKEVFYYDKDLITEKLNLLPICGKVIGVLFIGLTIFFCYLELTATYYSREGKIDKHKGDGCFAQYRRLLNSGKPYKKEYIESFKEQGIDFYRSAMMTFDKSTKYKYDPIIIYKAATTAFINLQELELSARYLRMLQNKTPNKNFAHNHAIAGMALFQKKYIKESIPHFKKEIGLYPLTVTTRYFLYIAYRMTQNENAANEVRDDILFALKIKGLTIQHLALVIDNAKYDMSPDLITDSMDIYSPAYKKRLNYILKDLGLMIKD